MRDEITLFRIFIIFVTLFFFVTKETSIFAQTALFKYKNRPDLDSFKEPVKFNLESDPKSPLASIVPLHHSDPSQIHKTISSLFPTVSIAVDERTRSILLYGTPSQNATIHKVISNLDLALHSIQIEVKIIELNYQTLDHYRHLFSDLSASFKMNYDFQNQKLLAVPNIENVLSLLMKKGDAKLLAKPLIATVENHKARVRIGDKIPYLTSIFYERGNANQVNYLDTGIDLELLPKIASANRIFTEIKASISSVKLWKELGTGQYPILSNRFTETQVYMEDGQTLIIAGLLDERHQKNTSVVPFFGELPFVGDIFKSHSFEKISSDIIFMITQEIKINR